MNIIICGIYSRAAFISHNVALWDAVYSRAALNRVNTVFDNHYITATFLKAAKK